MDTSGFNAHLLFFDRNADRHISLFETHTGLEQIGLGRLIALPATVMIHLGIAGLSVIRGDDLQNPLSLSIPAVGLLRHPDTALVDKGARFDSERVDKVFATYGRQHAGEALTFGEIAAMAAERLVQSPTGLMDVLLLPSGAAGTAIEWSALFWLAGEELQGRRILSKRAVLRFYTDPEFFFDVAKRVREERSRRAGSLRGGIRNFVQAWVL